MRGTAPFRDCAGIMRTNSHVILPTPKGSEASIQELGLGFRVWGLSVYGGLGFLYRIIVGFLGNTRPF